MLFRQSDRRYKHPVRAEGLTINNKDNNNKNKNNINPVFYMRKNENKQSLDSHGLN